MTPAPRPQLLDGKLKGRLAELVERLGVTGAARELRMSPSTIARLLAGTAVRKTSVFYAASALRGAR
jgi:hypothetical protein